MKRLLRLSAARRCRRVPASAEGAADEGGIDRVVGSVLAAAYPPLAAPESLRRRLAKSSVTDTSQRRRLAGRWRLVLATGGLVLIGVTFTLFFGARREGVSAALLLERVRDAMNGVEAFHLVTTNERGERRAETWFARGLGFRSESWQVDPRDGIAQEGGEQYVHVDDRRRSYQWQPARNELNVRSSNFHEPDWVEKFTRFHTAAGILDEHERERGIMREAVERFGPTLTVGDVRRGGRQLRELRIVRRDYINRAGERERSEDAYLVDPASDRIVEVETRRFPSGHTLRFRIEYPAPKTLAPALFNFAIPAGAKVRAWVPLAVEPDVRIEVCLRNLQAFCQPNDGKTNRRSKPERKMERLAGGQLRLYPHARITWCPADPRQGEAGYTSYRVFDESTDDPDLSRAVMIECRHHAGRLVRGYADGQAEVVPAPRGS